MVDLDDKTHHVIFNASAYEKETNPGIKEFLSFVRNNTAESDLTKEIAGMVQAKKFEQTFINEYLAWNLHDKDVERRGRKEQALETARVLKQSGVDAALIVQATGLSIEDVKALR